MSCMNDPEVTLLVSCTPDDPHHQNQEDGFGAEIQFRAFSRKPGLKGKPRA